METITFQHLDTINLFSSNDVNLIGRTLKGESVCLRISEIRPHFCIQLDRAVNAVAWFDQFKRNVWLYQLSKTATKHDETKDKVPNVARKRENIPKDYLMYKEIDGKILKTIVNMVHAVFFESMPKTNGSVEMPNGFFRQRKH